MADEPQAMVAVLGSGVDGQAEAEVTLPCSGAMILGLRVMAR